MADFIRTAQGLSDIDLDEIEQEFGFSFPADFRNQYLVHNGGRPKNNLFKKDESIFVISEFFPIKHGRVKGLFEDVFRDLKVDQAILPSYLIPFADDPGGDFYCFSVRDSDVGSIWIYRGEYSDDPDRTVEFLAKSLNEFLESMTAEVGDV